MSSAAPSFLVLFASRPGKLSRARLPHGFSLYSTYGSFFRKRDRRNTNAECCSLGEIVKKMQSP